MNSDEVLKSEIYVSEKRLSRSAIVGHEVSGLAVPRTEKWKGVGKKLWQGEEMIISVGTANFLARA